MSKKILALLEGGAKQRDELCRLTGLPDRKIREQIAELQAYGYPVVSLEKGYRLGTPKDVEHYLRREKRRAVTILKKIRHLVPHAEAVIQQLSIEF